MKRVFLFLSTNLAIMVVLGLITTLTGANRFFTESGLDLPKLLLFSAILGFGGSFISLWISKFMAKRSTGARVITKPQNPTEVWLVQTVETFARRANIPMPEVAIYDGEPNAFATGPSRNNSLVAVSTGLLQTMSKEEAEAVIAHEVAHVANGDMVTLTLIQGVVNTFVFFLARVVAWLVESFLRRGQSESQSGPSAVYYIVVVVADIVFGILASLIVMYFSRQREFRADSGASKLMGTPQPMAAALRKLGKLSPSDLPQNVATSGIQGRPAWTYWFASHPPIEARIAALQNPNQQ